MAHAQRQRGRQTRRSRLLGSIFSQAPGDTPGTAMPQGGDCSGEQLACRSTKTPAQASSWRDVTVRLARETLARRICTRFFTQSDKQRHIGATTACEAEFISVGQQLQSLSRNGAHGEAEHQTLAAVVEVSTGGGINAPGAELNAVSASLRSGVTARAA